MIIDVVVQFNLLTGRLSGTSACYKAGTKTQIKNKTVQIYRNITISKQNENNTIGKAVSKIPLTPKKTKII
jgi:hypothetical protein